MEKTLRYTDLKEFKFEDWDGKPFLAFYTDFPTDLVVRSLDEEPIRPAAQVIGYATYNGIQRWRLSTDVQWRHVYRLEDNEHFFNKFDKRPTHRQLSRWLSEGKGELLDITNYIVTTIVYNKSSADKQIPKGSLIRTWDSDEWVEPTTKMLGEAK